MRTQLFDRPNLLLSDSNCRLDEGIYSEVPLLVDKYGTVIDAPSSWFRSLVLNANSTRTVYQYATSIALYWKYLDHHELDWGTPSDRTLRVWRNKLRLERLHRSRIRELATINAHIECILRFYRWAQEDARCAYVIGTTPPGGRPYPVRLVRKSVRNIVRLTSDLLFPIPRKPRKPIPTTTEMEQLYQALGGPSPMNKRNCLICKWATGSGLRRTEILSLTVDDLPSLTECQRLRRENKIAFIEIVGKNGTRRDVPILPEVLEETHYFILEERHDMLTELKVHSEKGIFVSKIGGILNGQYLSRIITDAFKKFGGRKLTLHRLRARFASRLVQFLRADEEERAGRAGVREETILERAAQYLGHANLAALRYYLNVDLDSEEVPVIMAMKASTAQSSRIMADAPNLQDEWASH